jgi:uncharacterized protein (TIGR03086 family)
MSDVLEFYDRAVDGFRRRLVGVGAGQWEAATPCTEWNVRQLVGHVLDEQLWVPPLVEGESIESVGDRFAGDQLGDDAVAAWDRATTAVRESLRQPGALERTVHLSFGDFPAEFYARQVASDTVIHTWDLARGVRADDRLDVADLAQAEQVFAPMVEMGRQAGVLGAPVDPAPDADDQARILAVFGRQA